MVKRFGAAWIAAMMILCLLFSFSAAGFGRGCGGGLGNPGGGNPDLG